MQCLYRNKKDVIQCLFFSYEIYPKEYLLCCIVFLEYLDLLSVGFENAYSLLSVGLMLNFFCIFCLNYRRSMAISQQIFLFCFFFNTKFKSWSNVWTNFKIFLQTNIFDWEMYLKEVAKFTVKQIVDFIRTRKVQQFIPSPADRLLLKTSSATSVFNL